MKSVIKQIKIGLIFLGLTAYSQAAVGESATQWVGARWDLAVSHVSDTWEDGDLEVYVPLWTYHMRWHYDHELTDGYNEFPAGIGLGKGRYNASGNWEGMYAMGFLDSYSNPSFMAGYGWIPTWNIGNTKIKAGIGATAFLMSRQSYYDSVPFPGVLPVAAISYKDLALQAAYVPGLKRGSGNVLFVWGKWTFN